MAPKPENMARCAAAAALGDLDLLHTLRAAGVEWDHRTCDQAAANGHLEVLKWARTFRCEWRTAAEDAAANGHAVSAFREKTLFCLLY